MGALVRHKLGIRIAHWVNAVAFVLLAISGVGVLVAHPQFYWGETGYFGMQPWLKLWFEPNFPQTSWGRNLHFLFAWVFVVNGAIYVAATLVSGYVRRRLLPSREQLRAGNVGAELRTHLKWRRPAATGRPDYNVLQKTAYLVVIFVLAPLMVLTGLTMSPGFVAVLPELTTLFGGRQSARSIHFIAANLLLLFLVAHVLEVALSGGVSMLRAMVTGTVHVRERRS